MNSRFQKRDSEADIDREQEEIDVRRKILLSRMPEEKQKEVKNRETYREFDDYDEYDDR